MMMSLSQARQHHGEKHGKPNSLEWTDGNPSQQRNLKYSTCYVQNTPPIRSCRMHKANQISGGTLRKRKRKIENVDGERRKHTRQTGNKMHGDAQRTFVQRAINWWLREAGEGKVRSTAQSMFSWWSHAKWFLVCLIWRTSTLESEWRGPSWLPWLDVPS